MPQNDTHSHQNGETTVTTPLHPPLLTLHLQAMTSTTSTSTDPLPSDDGAAAVRAVNKRFEGLLTVRTKAIKGKGAWYWAHLEPILVPHPDTGLPKSVKLKCSLCDSLFSASNPSRTASEHLKRGTCSNFSSGLRPGSVPSPLPISSITPGSNRKRGSPQMGATSPSSYQNHSLALVESSRFDMGYTPMQNSNNNSNSNNNNNNNIMLLQHHGQSQQHLMLSGGKDDLCALAMFEDSVKKLKSPKTSPGPALNKDQVNSALDLLFDWFYETCGSVSLSSLEHRKFQAFLGQVGLPANLRREVSGGRLDARFGEAKAESEARIRDAMFFQLASDGWKSGGLFNFNSCCGGGESLVKFVVNLPNGSSVFQKAVFTGGVENSKYAEEVLWEMVTAVTGSVVHRCVGIVADKFKAKALRNLEAQHHWMVNTSCQLQGLVSLIKDFNRELPLFRSVIENCLKVANFMNSESQVRSLFLKCRVQEMDCGGLIRVPSPKCDPLKNFQLVFPMLEEILSCARVIQMVVMEDGFKVMCMEDTLVREVAGMVQNEGFWNELEAVYSLVKLVRGMVHDVEAERPLMGRCLPLWEELRSKVKEWCGKFNIVEGPVEKIVEKRFRKNYHPAWAAAFILDPLYLIKDASGKYLPPYKCLTREQEKDVDKLLTRLASREEAHVVLMELMKWRSDGLDPLYAQAVQMKQRDPVTGKMKVANPLSSRLVWETCLSEFKSLGKIAVRLIFQHATSCGFKSNWSFMRKFSANKQSRVALERAQKMIYIAAHAKLERRDFSSEEEKDAELFAMSGSEDGMLAEVYADAPLVINRLGCHDC
ncbi:uncharacterized protein LOC124825291 isoform X1 [Vigna umbellata]|uniref:uncharacterized protein LOC124825291 isoform X1 n=1 Tax=Vigna umbellata TaxID=87088 RepID=UPI001F5EBAFB|nr:uncharacterized protein LOC124825291 isoform X1 [Vigna umbellata]XP_047153834.1 uncharacterized protein LOC124825291 isoform X1 [Vigna umbellata]